MDAGADGDAGDDVQPHLADDLAHGLLRAVEGGPCLIGEFVDAQGTDYVMVVNRDFTAAGNLKLTLQQPAAAVLEISKTTGVPVPLEGYIANSGTLNLVLAPGEGRLLRLR